MIVALACASYAVAAGFTAGRVWDQTTSKGDARWPLIGVIGAALCWPVVGLMCMVVDRAPKP